MTDPDPFELFPNDLNSPAGAIHDAAGHALTICVICLAHKWDDPELAVAQAVTIVDGQALCIHHWEHEHAGVRHDRTDHHRWLLALGLIAELTDQEDCRYDHHGYCQTHHLDPDPCPYHRARLMLADPEHYTPPAPTREDYTPG